MLTSPTRRTLCHSSLVSQPSNLCHAAFKRRCTDQKKLFSSQNQIQKELKHLFATANKRLQKVQNTNSPTVIKSDVWPGLENTRTYTKGVVYKWSPVTSFSLSFKLFTLAPKNSDTWKCQFCHTQLHLVTRVSLFFSKFFQLSQLCWSLVTLHPFFLFFLSFSTTWLFLGHFETFHSSKQNDTLF